MPAVLSVQSRPSPRCADVKDIKCVINFDFPKNSETYLHRVSPAAECDVIDDVIGDCFSAQSHTVEANE